MIRLSISLLIYLIFTYNLFCQCNCYRIQKDYSTVLDFVSNPQNNWEIGYSSSSSLDTTYFLKFNYADLTGNTVSMYHPSNQVYYPYLGQNTSDKTLLDNTKTWAVKPKQFTIEGSNSGQYSIIRFRIPESGLYKVSASFEGIHSGISSTDVHVNLNNTSLFSENINGYGGDANFFTIQGSNPSTKYESVAHFNKNVIITFAVGYGNNGNHYNDTTGLIASILKLYED